MSDAEGRDDGGGLSPAEAYKFGFLIRCAQEGLDDDGVDARVRKAASFEGLLGRTAGTGLAALALGSLGLGAVAGHAGSRLLDPEFDVKELQRKELAELYGSFADDLDDKNRKDLKDPEVET